MRHPSRIDTLRQDVRPGEGGARLHATCDVVCPRVDVGDPHQRSSARVDDVERALCQFVWEVTYIAYHESDIEACLSCLLTSQVYLDRADVDARGFRTEDGPGKSFLSRRTLTLQD